MVDCFAEYSKVLLFSKWIIVWVNNFYRHYAAANNVCDFKLVDECVTNLTTYKNACLKKVSENENSCSQTEIKKSRLSPAFLAKIIKESKGSFALFNRRYKGIYFINFNLYACQVNLFFK